jgi:hypothetical protein
MRSNDVKDTEAGLMPVEEDAGIVATAWSCT